LITKYAVIMVLFFRSFNGEGNFRQGLLPEKNLVRQIRVIDLRGKDVLLARGVNLLQSAQLDDDLAVFLSFVGRPVAVSASTAQENCTAGSARQAMVESNRKEQVRTAWGTVA